MAVGFGKSRGVTVLPMTKMAREFVLSGIRQQKKVKPRLAEDDVAQLIVTPFAQTEIQTTVPDAGLNGYDVIIFFSYEPPINERIMELRHAMQIAKRSSADRITVVMTYMPYSRGDKQDQYHGSIALKDLAKDLDRYGAHLIVCDLHNPTTLGFFESARMLSLREVLMAKAKEDYEIEVVVAPDAGGVKRARKWSEDLYIDRELGRGVLDKKRKGNDDTAMSERYFGDSVRGKNVLLVDDEIATGSSMVSGAVVLERAGAREIRAAAYHGILAGPAIERLLKSPITKLTVTNTVPVSMTKVKQASGKLRVASIESFLIEAARKWYAGESLKPMIEYAY